MKLERLPENIPFQLPIDRLRSLCDVVVGVVILGLVLNLDIPDLSQIKSAAHLSDAFTAQLPAFFSFIVSFLVIGKCWQIHNLLFCHLQTADKRMFWVTMFYLLSIALLVLTAGIRMSFDNFAIVNSFSASLMLPGIFLSMLCARVVYAWQHDKTLYLSENHKRAAVILMLKIFLIPAIGVISIFSSFYSPRVAYYLWASVVLVIFI